MLQIEDVLQFCGKRRVKRFLKYQKKYLRLL